MKPHCDSIKTFVALALCLGFSSALLAQTMSQPPAIKGHRIGESFNDYLVIAKGGNDNAARTLTDCGNFVGDKKNQKRYESGNGDMDFQSRFDNCLIMSKVLRGDTAVVQDGLQEFMFVAQKLVMIKLSILEDFAKVRDDLIQKYGIPDVEENVQYQNGFGAVFTHPRASWLKRQDVVVIANEEANPVVDAPAVPKIYAITVQIIQRA